MIVYTGTSGYGYREWKGKFYPEHISSGEMLRFYGSRFNTVEINNTFYRMPRESMLASWAGQVGQDFLFAIKAPQLITHVKQLRNVGTETARFFNTLSELGRKLGPVLFQFPASFQPDRSLLEDFLELIPGDNECAFEFRSRLPVDDAMMDLLRSRGCSLCVADTDEQPAREIISTAGWGYLRLRRRNYTGADLAEWKERIVAQKWERAFVFFKHEEEARGPALALRFRGLAEQSSFRNRFAAG